MRVAVISSKICYAPDDGNALYATDGGFPLQMHALSELFDEMRVVVPVVRGHAGRGAMPLGGPRMAIAPLAALPAGPVARRLLFPVWLARQMPAFLREIFRADAIHAVVPGDVGLVGMVLAFLLRKPLFVRHCGNWLSPRTPADHFLKWFGQACAGGRTVVFATGGGSAPPSQKNPSVKWIFATSLTEGEVKRAGRIRAIPPPGEAVRLIHVARQEPDKGAATVVGSLPMLLPRFPNVQADIVGEGSALASLKDLARELGVAERVHFHGRVDHDAVMRLLQDACLMCFPTASSEGFPKAVHEALAAGLPVVTTAVSVLPDLIGDTAGVVLPGNTAQDLGAAVAAILSDPTRYRSMSAAAVTLARNYTLERWRDTIGAELQRAWGTLRNA